MQENQQPLVIHQEDDEQWRQSIAARVFLNHFFGMHYHIRETEAAGKLADLERFRTFSPRMNETTLDVTKRMLLNAWNTEYALRNTATMGDDSFLSNALHWTFPQAYYCVWYGLRAFLATQGVLTNDESNIRRRASRLVANSYYPRYLSFYADGPLDHYHVHRLPKGQRNPGLVLADSPFEAQAQIGQFLRTTRTLQLRSLRQKLQANPALALRSERTGKILEKFSSHHWQELSERVGLTTYLDLFSRLRISSTNREIERFVNVDVDFKLFHVSLLDIVDHINAIHEAYVVKAMGIPAYREFLGSLPDYLKNGFVQRRFTERIKPELDHHLFTPSDRRAA